MRPATQAGQTFYDLAPSRVAVLLIDLQNDFCSPELFSDKSPTNTLNAETAYRANDFARSAAALGCHVIYTRQVLDLPNLTNRQRRWERPDGLCAADENYTVTVFVKRL